MNIAAMPITLFCIHGNHEQRLFTISSYEETEWHGDIAYVEKEYPNILFANDVVIFELNGLKTIASGGVPVRGRLELGRPVHGGMAGWYCGHYHTDLRVLVSFVEINEEE